MVVNQKCVRIGIRKIKNRKIVEYHESGAKDGAKPHEEAQNKRDADKRQPPFIQKVNGRKNVWL